MQHAGSVCCCHRCERLLHKVQKLCIFMIFRKCDLLDHYLCEFDKFTIKIREIKFPVE